jgi:hypothetical protein
VVAAFTAPIIILAPSSDVQSIILGRIEQVNDELSGEGSFLVSLRLMRTDFPRRAEPHWCRNFDCCRLDCLPRKSCCNCSRRSQRVWRSGIYHRPFNPWVSPNSPQVLASVKDCHAAFGTIWRTYLGESCESCARQVQEHGHRTS